MNKLLKNKTCLCVLAALFYFFGIFLVVDEYLWPVKHIGKAISFYAIGVLLIAYAVFLLIKLLKKTSNQTMQIIVWVEFVVNLVCAIVLMVEKKGSVYIGITLYMRGLSELIALYITKYSRLSRFVLAVIMVTVAVFLIASNLIKDEYFLYVLFAMVFGIAIYFTALFLKIPKKVRTKKTKTKKVTTTKKEETEAKAETKTETKKVANTTKKTETKTENKK